MRRRIVAMAERPELWLGLLLAWVCLSALRSWHTPWARAAGTEALRWTVGIGLTLTLGMGLRRTSRLAQALTVSLGVLAAIIVLVGRRPDGMVTGPYGDHQLCASALLALLPFSIAVALASPRPAWRWTGQIIALAAAVCLALTQTRAAWAGGVAGGCVFAFLWLCHAEASHRRLPKVVMPGLLATGVILAFVLLVRGTDLGDPLAARAATLGALGQDADWQWRLHTWGGVLQMISRHPWAGWGPGHYAAAHWPFTRLAPPISPWQRPSLSDEAHNFYLQTTADLGLIGLGLYLGALAAFTRLVLRTLADCASSAQSGGRHAMRRTLLIASLSLLAAQGVDGLASPSWQFAEVSLLSWLGLGLGLAAVRPVMPLENQARLPVPYRRALQCAAAGLAAVVLVSQALPAGLLPASATPLAPEQNYAPTLTSVTVTETTGIMSVSKPYPSLSYIAVATYSDGSKATVTQSSLFHATGNCVFPIGVGGNTLTVIKNPLSNLVTITATYEGVSGTTTLTVN